VPTMTTTRTRSSSVQQHDVICVTHLVIGSVQPRRAVGTQLGAVEASTAVGRTQRTQQRRVETAAEHARRTPGRRRRRDGGGGGATAPDAVGMNERVTAKTEVDSAGNGARRAVDDRRATRLETSAADARRPRR